MEQPKVRFNQNSEIVGRQTKNEDISTKNARGKLKVKSIVPINLPVKVLKNGKRVLVKAQDNNSKITGQFKTITSDKSQDIIENQSQSSTSIIITDSGSSSPIDLSNGDNLIDSETPVGTCFQQNQFPEIEEVNKSNGLDKIQSCVDKINSITITDPTSISQEIESSEKHIPCVTCDDSNNEDSDLEIIQVIKNPTKSKSTEENKFAKRNHSRRSEHILKLSSGHKKINDTSTQYTQLQKENKPKYCKSANDHQVQNELLKPVKTKVLNDATNGCSTISKCDKSKESIKKQTKLQVMPCAKFRTNSINMDKYSEKLITQTKKHVLLNTAQNKRSVSLPGSSHKKCNVTSTTTKFSDKSNIVSKNLLSRPEYNSTICVIKKLKEIEKEKLVTDVEHLPQEYKNLIYGKVSTALDFAPHETVYKDLINLSVDDHILPTRLMRSKDPEPRDKDIMPKLSDFYTPKYTEQYFMIGSPATPSPININTLHAFAISNKIQMWKMSRDSF